MLLGNGKIVANKALCRRLYKDITDGSLAHAYIIEGSRGSGRHTLAKNIIAALACTGDPSTLPCGQCKSCIEIFEDKCPDVMTLKKEKDRSGLGIDAVRELKGSILSVPNNLEVKAYILDDTDTMTVQAQNALLLTLEEPPKNVYFFIICENSRSLLETIRSRAAILRTDRLSNVEISDYLLGATAPKSISEATRTLKRSAPHEFDLLLLYADGSIGRAIELLSPKEREPIKELRLLADRFISSLITGGGSVHPILLFSEFSDKRDKLLLQLERIKDALRDLILLKKSENVPLKYYVDRDSALEISDRLSEKRLFAVIEAADSATDSLSRNANVRLTLTEMLSSL